MDLDFKKVLLKKIIEKVDKIELPQKIPVPKKTIKIAITGLSRSGKSVFITSLINQFIADDKMEYFHEKTSKRYIAKLLPPDGKVERFDYFTNLKNFRLNPPIWPESTKSISKSILELEVKSPFSWMENRFIELEIVDYPGEWLLDLELLSISYEQFSQQYLEYLSKKADKTLLAKYYEFLTKRVFDERLISIYHDILLDLNERGYSYILPGRFLQAGDLKDDPMLDFVPLPSELGSLNIYKTFQNRYTIYVNQIVKRLYLEHFNKFDIQIFLVDLIKVLRYGYDSFEDLHFVLKKILEFYTYGKNGFLGRLFNRKIDHVVFAGTKADNITNNQHQNYKKLLDELIEDLKRELDVRHIKTDTMILSAVKSTTNVLAMYENREISCLRGVLEGENEESTHYPGEMPDDFTKRESWKNRVFDFPKFRPNSFPLRDTHSVENIRMDRLITYILKDRI